ncbi:MAG TPA: DUF2110 family protein [Candidatus Binatus sp.]|nr:DUF2110 family protein [Candidatus Binatus sp.]
MSQQNKDWQSISLAEKIPENILRHNPSLVDQYIRRMSQGLKLEWKSSISNNGWLSIHVRGEDAEAFQSLLLKKFGEASIDLSKIEKWDLARGFITGLGRVGYGVYVDIGIQQPRPKDALYPLHRMRAQLSDGALESVKQISTMNALVDYFPVKVLVTEVDGDRVSVELADETHEQLMNLRKYPFDRLIAVGLTKTQAENTVREMNVSSDVVEVRELSLFVQELVFKIGTEAPGMIAKMGNRLRGVNLAAYRAWKTLE